MPTRIEDEVDTVVTLTANSTDDLLNRLVHYHGRDKIDRDVRIANNWRERSRRFVRESK